MPGSVIELHHGTRTTRGEHGRMTVVRRFMVDLTLGTGTLQITPEYAPFVSTSSDGGPGVPQLGSAMDDLRDATRMDLVPRSGFVPKGRSLWMIGFRSDPTVSPYHVEVECEFDNFTLGKFRTYSVAPTYEEWPTFQRHPVGADVAAGLIVRHSWSLQILKFPSSRSILQVRMKLKVLPTVLQAALAAEAGKVHTFDSQFWIFDGAQSVQVGAPGSVDDKPVWDIRYQWTNDPGFAGYNQATNPELFATGAAFDPLLAVVPRVPNTAPGTSVANTYRPPFFTYAKIPQRQLEFGEDTPIPGANQPRIDIVKNANFNPLGWQTLPGNPLGT